MEQIIYLKRGIEAKCEQHRWHLVNPSPWPIIVAFSVLQVLLSLILTMHGVELRWYINENISRSTKFFVSWIDVISTFGPLMWGIYSWFSDIITEATYEGQHTVAVQNNLKFGMLLFITSEVFFFIAFFWSFFHFSLVPIDFISTQWPISAIKTLNPWGIPLLNTIILLSSGITLTWSHRALIAGWHISSIDGLITTVAYGALFTLLQIYEYRTSTFNINDTSYGSIFFMGTGFHGFHVLVGSIFLAVCLIRQIKRHFMRKHHVGFECAAWYWHFVDVVWLLLFTVFYVWGA